MALQILSQSYGPRLPKVVCTADSLDELAGLSCAEGSTATVGDTEYVFENNSGWVEPGSGGTGGGVLVVNVDTSTMTLDKTAGEMWAAAQSGVIVIAMIHDGMGQLFGVTFASNLEGYAFGISTSDGIVYFVAASADDYPTRTAIDNGIGGGDDGTVA